MQTMPQTPEELINEGEKIYFEKKDEMEKSHFGEFAVIEVESKEIFIDKDKLIAFQNAQQKYPNKLFFITQIGNLKHAGSDLNEVRKYGWAFQ